MKLLLLLTMFLVVSGCLSAQKALAGDEDFSSAKAPWEVVVDRLGDTTAVKLPVVEDLLMGDTLVLRQPNHQVGVTNFYASRSDSSSVAQFRHQGRFFVNRRQNFGPLAFNLGGVVYHNDWEVDRRRSGATLGFDHQLTLDQLKLDHGDWFAGKQQQFTDLVAANNDRISEAESYLEFEKMLDLKNDPRYQEYYERVMRQTDSLRDKQTELISEAEGQLLERRAELERFHSEYDERLSKVSAMSAEARESAERVIDSIQSGIDLGEEEVFIQELLRSQKIGLVEKLLLRTERLDVGNTQLGEDGFTTLGLPIRGLNFVYSAAKFGAEVQYGKRIVSNRFLPRDGVAFHDQNSNARFSRAAFRYGAEDKAQITVAYLEGRQVNVNGGPTASRFLKKNQVATISGTVGLGELLLVSGHVANSNTQPLSNKLTPAVESEEMLERSAARLAVAADIENFTLELAAFRNAQGFESFANPYLFTDYQGIETTLTAALLKGRLSGNLSVANGNGTTEQTEGNRRWRVNGGLRFAVTPRLSAGAQFSPNVFRYEVDNQEGLSQTTIYRGDLMYFGKKWRSQVSVTNLDQGFNWNDTTTVNSRAILQATLQVDLSEKFQLQSTNNRTLQASGDAAADWLHGLSLAGAGKFNWSLGVQYARYRFEDRPSPGVSLDVSAPLGKSGQLRFNLFYRQIPLGESTPPEILSQQDLNYTF